MIKRIVSLSFISVLLIILGGFCFIFFTLVVTEKVVELVTLGPALKVSSIEDWEDQREVLLKNLQSEQYGIIPTTEVVWEISKEVLDDNVLAGRAQYELWTLQAPESDFALHIVGLFPSSTTVLPAVIASNFCPHHIRYPEYIVPIPAHYPSMCESDGLLGGVVSGVFGEYLTTYPVEDFVENEVILINIYLAEGVADDPIYFEAGLKQVSELTGENVSGVLAAWAWIYSEVSRVFSEDNRVDEDRIALYGHSRDGKSALLAAAFDEDIDMVLSHQSGKGGAAPWQREVGESIEGATKTYGFWYSPNFIKFSGRPNSLGADQHALIAAIAPRPVLLSNAWMDKWGDPVGVMQAVLNATPVYELYGAQGISEGTLSNFYPDSELSYFIRPWTHGVRASDWTAFFSFMSSHFNEEVGE